MLWNTNMNSLIQDFQFLTPFSSLTQLLLFPEVSNPLDYEVIYK